MPLTDEQIGLVPPRGPGPGTYRGGLSDADIGLYDPSERPGSLFQPLKKTWAETKRAAAELGELPGKAARFMLNPFGMERPPIMATTPMPRDIPEFKMPELDIEEMKRPTRKGEMVETGGEMVPMSPYGTVPVPGFRGATPPTAVYTGPGQPRYDPWTIGAAGAYNETARYLNELLSRQGLPQTLGSLNPIGIALQAPSYLLETPEKIVEAGKKIGAGPPEEKGAAAMDVVGRIAGIIGGKRALEASAGLEKPPKPTNLEQELQEAMEHQNDVENYIKQWRERQKKAGKPIPPQFAERPAEPFPGEGGADVPRRPAAAPGMGPGPRLQIGLDLNTLKETVPAVKIGARMLTGALRSGESHDDIIKKGGADPNMYPHADPSRGFTLTEKGAELARAKGYDVQAGEFLDRRKAEQITGAHGTARAGGLDSQDLFGGKRHDMQETLVDLREKGYKTLYSESGIRQRGERLEDVRSGYVVISKEGLSPEKLENIKRSAENIGAKVEEREHRIGVYLEEGTKKEVLQDWSDFTWRLRMGPDPRRMIELAQEYTKTLRLLGIEDYDRFRKAGVTAKQIREHIDRDVSEFARETNQTPEQVAKIKERYYSHLDKLRGLEGEAREIYLQEAKGRGIPEELTRKVVMDPIILYRYAKGLKPGESLYMGFDPTKHGKELADALRELRASDVSKKAPSGDIPPVGEEVRAGAPTEGAPRPEEQKALTTQIRYDPYRKPPKGGVKPAEVTLRPDQEALLAKYGVTKEDMLKIPPYASNRAGFLAHPALKHLRDFQFSAERYKVANIHRMLDPERALIRQRFLQDIAEGKAAAAKAAGKEVKEKVKTGGVEEDYSDITLLNQIGVKQPGMRLPAKATKLTDLSGTKLLELYRNTLQTVDKIKEQNHPDKLARATEAEKKVAADIYSRVSVAWDVLEPRFQSAARAAGVGKLLGVEKAVAGKGFPGLNIPQEALNALRDSGLIKEGGTIPPDIMKRLREDVNYIFKEEAPRLTIGPNLKPLLDTLRGLQKDYRWMLQYRKSGDEIFARRDAVDAKTQLAANQAENHLHQVTKDQFPGFSDRGLKLADQAALAAFVAKTKTGLARLKLLSAGNKDALAAVEFAEKNWAKVDTIANHAAMSDLLNVTAAGRAKVAVESFDNFISHIHKQPTGLLGLRPEPSTFRKYSDVFEAIAQGETPRTLSMKGVMNWRTTDILRDVNMKQWIERFKKVNDPSNGKPLVTTLGKGGPPPGYVKSKRFNVAIQRSYAPLFSIAAMESLSEVHPVLRNILEGEGSIKHMTLAFDFYHLWRITQFGLSMGVGKGAMAQYFLHPERGGKGLAMVELEERDLASAIKNGDADPRVAAYQKEVLKLKQGNIDRRSVGNLLIDEGLNIGRHGEAIYSSFVRRLPVFGPVNRFIFDRVSRGVMYEAAQRQFEQFARANPNMSLREVARKTAFDVNTRLGNIGQQGIIKGKPLQELSTAFFLAPRWVESMAQSEIRSAYRVVRGVADVVTGAEKPRAAYEKLGALGKGTLNLAAVYFAGTQIMNMILNNGRSTFENPNNEGHEFDLFIPPLVKGEKGFFVNPLNLPMELTHDFVRYREHGESSREAVAHIISNKLSPYMQAGRVLATGKDWRGEKVPSIGGALAQALQPVPIIGKQAVETYKQKQLAPVERSAIALGLGVKAEPETTLEQRSREAMGGVKESIFGPEGRPRGLLERAITERTERRKMMVERPLTREQKLAAGEHTAELEYKRGSEIQASLPEADRNWLESRKEIIPGYQSIMHIGDMPVHLTAKEMKRYEEFFKEALEVQMRSLRRVYDRIPNREMQKQVFSEHMKDAHELARTRLEAEILQKDRQERGRYSIYQ